MAMAGDTFTTLIREVWTPELINSVFYNSAFVGSTDSVGNAIFNIGNSAGGAAITTGHTVAVDSNTEAYSYDEAMPTANTTTQVAPYFTKDYYQTAARVFGVKMNQLQGGGETGNLDSIRETLENAAKDHWDIVNKAMIADLEAQIDSSSAYSDASLSRSTYPALASYEDAVDGALALSDLEDLLESLLDNDRGGRLEDYALLMPFNQKTNLSRLGAGSGAGYNIQTAPLGNMDVGRFATLETWNGIPIVPIHNMTDTTILAVHRPSTNIYWNRQLEIKERGEQADTMLFHLMSGANIVTHNPKMSGKLTGVTA